jgi:hypothetical protein
MCAARSIPHFACEVLNQLTFPRSMDALKEFDSWNSFSRDLNIGEECS